ncbi:MAG: hypothetical protein IKZ87_07980, partial [Actinomycetaceae bacterium]|nr:hypothetical protein [Actinomycetaceae bacterium]
FFGGFAVEASAIEGIVDISAFISLFHLNLPGSPFAPDRPVDILEVPTNPFLRVRHAVSPIDDRAVLGGIVEYPPYDGTGTVRAGELETDLLWIEPSRLSTGARLLRYYPGQREPQVRGIYHGATWGWEDCTTGKFRAFTPSHLVGSAISRIWGETPVDIETDDNDAPVAVQMVCSQIPEEESGFQLVESGLFAKRIAYHENLKLHEPHLVGIVNSIPVRVIRTMEDGNGTTLAFCVAMILDMPLVFAHGFDRWAQGVAVKTVPFDEVQNLHMQAAEVPNTGFDTMPVVTLLPDEHETPRRILGQGFLLLSNFLPQGWKRARILVQVVGEAVGLGGQVAVPSGATGELKYVQIDSIPSAFKSYGIWFKEANIDPNEGAPLTVTFDFEADTLNVDVELNYKHEPEGSENVPLEQWAIELERFPRSVDKTPEWLRNKVDVALKREAEKTTTATLPRIGSGTTYGQKMEIAEGMSVKEALEMARNADTATIPRVVGAKPEVSLKKKAEEAAALLGEL